MPGVKEGKNRRLFQRFTYSYMIASVQEQRTRGGRAYDRPGVYKMSMVRIVGETTDELAKVRV